MKGLRRTGIAAALLLGLTGTFLAGCQAAPAAPETPAPTVSAAPAATPTPTPAPTPTPTPEPIRACLTVAGDLVIHESINNQALADGGGEVYDYAPMFGDLTSYIQAADYAACCMETTFPGDAYSYVGYPLFRSPDALAFSLADVGFDLIATASNHALDSGEAGLQRTLDVLDEAGLAHVGTYRSPAERDENRGILIQDVGGISVAFLNYSYGTNGISKDSYPYGINVYYQDYMTYFREIDYELVAGDMAAARALDTDLIAVMVHWGPEYWTSPSQAQTEFADYLFQEGADLVLGGHPHVPQPMELRTITEADGSQRQGFLCFCLGNLLSSMNDDYTYLTALLQLQLEKDPVTGETAITDAGYVPGVLVDLQDYGVWNGPWRYRLWDLHAAVADYEAGNDRGLMNEYMYNRFLDYIRSMQEICGKEYDLGARKADDEA